MMDERHDDRSWVVWDMTIPDSENPAWGPMFEGEAKAMVARDRTNRWARDTRVSALRSKAVATLTSRAACYGITVDPGDEARMIAAFEDEMDSSALAKARSALRVVAYDLAHIEWMREHDPMGLRQIAAALPDFEGVDPLVISTCAGDPEEAVA
jgi:hypothetical protein